METMELYIGFYIFAVKYFCALKNHQKKKIHDSIRTRKQLALYPP